MPSLGAGSSVIVDVCDPPAVAIGGPGTGRAAGVGRIEPVPPKGAPAASAVGGLDAEVVGGFRNDRDDAAAPQVAADSA